MGKMNFYPFSNEQALLPNIKIKGKQEGKHTSQHGEMQGMLCKS
jgi:hypothetical protein